MTRKELYAFKKEVRTWLDCCGVNVEYLRFESSSDMGGYVVCWNKLGKEYVLFNKEEWSEYVKSKNSERQMSDIDTLTKGLTKD